MIRSHMQTRQHHHQQVVKNPFAISTSSSDPHSISIKERSEDGSIEWTDELESLFFQSFISSTCTYKPVGVNKHFNMLIAYHRFTNAIGRDIDVAHLWAKLESMYDLNALEDGEEIPFPGKENDFSLEETDFHQIMSEKRKDGPRSSRDHKESDKSRGVKEEEFSTPPPLAVAKRTGSILNSAANKRKISTSSHSSNEGKDSPRKSPVHYAIPATKKRR